MNWFASKYLSSSVKKNIYLAKIIKKNNRNTLKWLVGVEENSFWPRVASADLSVGADGAPASRVTLTTLLTSDTKTYTVLRELLFGRSRATECVVLVAASWRTQKQLNQTLYVFKRRNISKKGLIVFVLFSVSQVCVMVTLEGCEQRITRRGRGHHWLKI